MAVALLTSLALVAAGCAGPRRGSVQVRAVAAEPPAAIDSPERTGVRHVVRAGQTLWRIAWVYGVTVDELARVNGIDDPTSLAEGRALLVPGATAVLDVPPYPAPLPGVPVVVLIISSILAMQASPIIVVSRPGA